MIDSKKWENDTLYKANHVLNALSCKAVHGLDGTDGWDDCDILTKSECDYCKFCCGEPYDCDITELIEDSVDVVYKLIQENQKLKNMLQKYEGAVK